MTLDPEVRIEPGKSALPKTTPRNGPPPEKSLMVLATAYTVTPSPLDETKGLNIQVDGWNRVTRVTYGSTIDVSYSYNGVGDMTVRTNNLAASGSVSTTDLYYSGKQVLEERDRLPTTPADDTTAVTEQYVWSPRYVDSPVLRTQTTATYDAGESSWNSATTTNYFLTDGNHNITAITDADGVVQERYVYSSFGKTTIYNADYSATQSVSTVGNTRLFAGMAIDLLTGLYDDNARIYSTSTDGFVTRDPAQGDANSYRYCFDNPTGLTDPSGLAVTLGSGSWTAPSNECQAGPQLNVGAALSVALADALQPSYLPPYATAEGTPFLITRYVGAGEAGIATSTGFIPNTTAPPASLSKIVFVTPDAPAATAAEAEVAYMIGAFNPSGATASPTHVIVGDKQGIIMSRANFVFGGTGLEMTTTQQIPVISVRQFAQVGLSDYRVGQGWASYDTSPQWSSAGVGNAGLMGVAILGTYVQFASLGSGDPHEEAMGVLMREKKGQNLFMIGYWSDGIGWQAAMQDFGAGVPPSGGAAPTSYDSTGETRVTLTAYNARGEQWQTIDPAGNETRTTFDDTGRTIETIQNYSTTIAPDKNLTTDYTFKAGVNLVSTVSVTSEKADLSGTQTQITAYVPGSDTGVSSAAIHRNDLVRAVVYGLSASDDLSRRVKRGHH